MDNRTKDLIIIGIIVLIAFLGYDTYNYLTVSQNYIQVGYLPGSHHAALFVADELGMFEKEGLNVQLVPFRTGSEVVDALDSGQIDIGYCGIAPATEAIDNGTPIKIVAPVNTEGSGLVVSDKLRINQVTDLRGHSVGIPKKGSVQDVLLRELLYQNNISPNDIKIVETEVPAMPASLQNGKIDSYIAWEPYVSSANTNQHGKILLYSGEWWDEHPCCVVVVRDSFIQNKPIELNKFLKAHVEATNYLVTYKEQSAEIMAKKLGTSYKTEYDSFNHVNYVSKLNTTLIEDFYKFLIYQEQLGYIKDNISVSSFDFTHLPT